MGTHKDFHVIRAMHQHREKAREAEELLARVRQEALTIHSLPGVYGISRGLIFDIKKHLEDK